MTDILRSSAAAGGGGVGDLDERVLAKQALDAAEEQLQSLCASHAGTFVSVERRGRAMEQALKDLQTTIKAVEGQVVNAQHALEQDDDKETSLAVLSEKHRVRRRTLLQHSTLLELLELPQLMDACVRSNLYEEALSIAAFSNTLERRHKDNNAVVTNVIAQIRSRQTDLRRLLLHRLKSSVTMPQCLEVVTALRRLNSIDLERQAEANLERVHAAMELRLQVDFLEARDAWLDSTTTAASAVGTTTTSPSRPSMPPPLPASEQLLDAIERYRTRVFEVATQFNAIFRAQTSTSSQASYVSLLSMWTARRVHSFLNLLSTQLLTTTQDSAALRDALEASVFFATSMGRLGADFTPQLAPIFESRMHALVVKSWNDGAQQLAETLKICRQAGVASPLISHTTDAATASEEASSSLAPQEPLAGPQPPPRQLMAVPPLARFVNSILAGLNDLRRCLLPGIFLQLRTSLDDVIGSVQQELVANERAVWAPGLRGEAAALRDAAARYKTVFADIVEPYIRGSLEAALGNKHGAEQFHTILRNNEKGPDSEEEEKEQEEEEKEEEQEEANEEENNEEDQQQNAEPPEVEEDAQEEADSTQVREMTI